MSTKYMIQNFVRRYLEERRQLGFDSLGHNGPLTLKIQLDWAREHVRRSGPITWARRLEVVRPFAAYYRQFEPDTEIPDSRTFGNGHRRRTPHIYTDQEICDLLDLSGRLLPLYGLRPATYKALFGLIAAAGLRLSEALHLNDTDVDLDDGTLTVRQTKFKKSRCLPIHSSVVMALSDYRRVRNRAVVCKQPAMFFVSPNGCALSSRSVHYVFTHLRNQMNCRSRGEHPNLRIHDLRHTFAVRRVLLWHESSVSTNHGMLWLSTYLGHAKISDTYWYLTATPELMAVAGSKFEGFENREE
jgi:integrase/recombinase XerC